MTTPTIVLHQFPGAFGMSSLSPFCTKLEAYLRLAQVPHEVVVGDVRRAPKAKMPYVVWDGQTVGDSSVIVDRLKAEVGDPLDGWLDARARGVGVLAQRTAEDHLYWMVLYVRWRDDAIWYGTYRDVIGAMLPAPIRWFLLPYLRRGVVSNLRAHGLGRHDPSILAKKCDDDLSSLEAVMSGRFLLGDRPTSYDCAVYAQIEQLRRTPGDHPMLEVVRSHDRILAYCDRVHEAIGWGEAAPTDGHAAA